MTPPRPPQPKSPNWVALLTAVMLVAPFLRALWQAMQAGATTWLPANGDVLLFGAVIAAVLIGDSLRHGRPTRSFLLALAVCLAAIGVCIAVFAVGLQFQVAEARQLGALAVVAPLVALACAVGTRVCLKRAFPDDSRR
jgi:drug/metabolite transporter (DMT)-like permease